MLDLVLHIMFPCQGKKVKIYYSADESEMIIISAKYFQNLLVWNTKTLKNTSVHLFI